MKKMYFLLKITNVDQWCYSKFPENAMKIIMVAAAIQMKELLKKLHSYIKHYSFAVVS